MKRVVVLFFSALVAACHSAPDASPDSGSPRQVARAAGLSGAQVLSPRGPMGHIRPVPPYDAGTFDAGLVGSNWPAEVCAHLRAEGCVVPACVAFIPHLTKKASVQQKACLSGSTSGEAALNCGAGIICR